MIKLAVTLTAFAILLMIGSCQPARLLAATSSTTQSTSQPAESFSIGLNLLPASSAGPAVYTASPAPATVHVNALNLQIQPGDWLSEMYCWDFGDPAGATIVDPHDSQNINLSNSLRGPVAAYQYQQPGTYQISLQRSLANGSTAVYSTTVIVPPSARTVYYIAPDGDDINPGIDPNHPLRSAAAAIKLVADHTEFRFRRGSVYTFEPEFAVKHKDILIDACGDPTQPLPILKRTPAVKKPPIAPDDCMTFTTWPGLTADVTIQHLRIDSNWTPAVTAGQYAYHAPAATFGILRGNNVTIANCEFANLVEGPHGDPAMNGLLLLNNRQVDPLGIPSRTLWLEGRDVVAIGNVAVNSVNESPLRAAATGVIGGLIAFNSIAQQLDPAHNRATAKAAVTLRTMQDVMITGNLITNGEFSFDPHSAAALDQRILVDSNAVNNSMIDIKTNVRHAVFSSNTIIRDGGPCITLNPGSANPAEWIEDLHLRSNAGQGWLTDARMLQVNPYNVNQLRQFDYDPAKNAFKKIPVPQRSTLNVQLSN